MAQVKAMDTHLSFSLKRSTIRSRILIPKYYDPDLAIATEKAAKEYLLPCLRELLYEGDAGSQLGHWIGREHYGTGTIPYVRTSDLSHWRIRPDYKKGVSEEIYEKYRGRQDVQPGDILMVAHGTYLVGNVAMVTGYDAQIVLQDHIFRLRVDRQSDIDPHYLLAALSTRFVRRQIRARQFSADIIDKVGDRHLEVRVPILRDTTRRVAISRIVQNLIDDQTKARDKFRTLTGSDLRMTRERADARYAFSLSRNRIRSRIFIPKYYDPSITGDLQKMERKDAAPWVTLNELKTTKRISITNGVEVGKMAYGTGSVPFIRTSDIIDRQIRLDVRQGISDKLYEIFADRASLEAGDVLVVRDGTYLVGASAIVTTADVPALICGGILRLRSLDPDQLSPYWLLAVLNLPIVRRQMRARQFTRDVIDTLGDRILEIRIPNPNTEDASKLAKEIMSVVITQQDVKAQIQEVIDEIEPEAPPILKGRPSWSMR